LCGKLFAAERARQTALRARQYRTQQVIVADPSPTHRFDEWQSGNTTPHLGQRLYYRPWPAIAGERLLWGTRRYDLLWPLVLVCDVSCASRPKPRDFKGQLSATLGNRGSRPTPAIPVAAKISREIL